MRVLFIQVRGGILIKLISLINTPHQLISNS